MVNPIGPLLPADEQFTHQIVETFATVGSTDPSWTEKVCAMAAARDGSLQLGFGLGKYTNRNGMDADSGVASGWVDVDGARTEITPETWVSTRDHSRGVRYGVGVPVTDMPPSAASAISSGASFEFLWSPILMERPDGSRYAIWREWSRV